MARCTQKVELRRLCQVERGHTSKEAQTLHAHEDAARGLSCRLRDRRYVQGNLPPVTILSERRQLSIRLVVHHRPGPGLLEREVDYALDHRSVGKRAGDRRLAPAGLACISGAGPREQLM